MSPPSPESTPVDDLPLPALNRTGHIAHCVRCLDGLPASLVEMDASRFASLLSLPAGACAYISIMLFLFLFQNGDRVLLSGYARRHRLSDAEDIADGSQQLERVDLGSICR
jgi:hypothetical protein